MITSWSRLRCIAAGLLLVPCFATAAKGEGPYHLLKEIPIGGPGGWDYLAIDETARRLYVTHATKIVVVDTTNDQIVGEIVDTPGVHGFAIARDLGLGFSSNGKENTVSVVDLKTLQTKSRIATGQGPDSILYASASHEVYTFNGGSHSSTVIDAVTGKVVATIPLPGDPEAPAYDPATGLIYDNIVDKNEVVVIDTKRHAITNTWSLETDFTSADGKLRIHPIRGQPTGMAIDSAHHRLFVGCRAAPQQMLMLDLSNGKFLTSVPIHSGVDADAFDPATQLAFASTGEGVLTIAREDAPDKLVTVQQVPTKFGARTMALDPSTHKVYLATAQFEPLPAGAPATTRRKPIDGTMKILVYGM